MRDTLSDQLLDAVYEAADTNGGLERLGRALAEALDAHSAMVIEIDPPAPPTVVQWGHDVAMGTEYAGRYGGIDPWVAVSPRVPPRTSVSVDRFVPWSELSRSEFYNDYLRRWGDMAHCLGLALPIEGRTTVISLQRTRRQGAFEPSDEEALQSLVPHLSRLARTRGRLQAVQQQARQLEALVDGRRDALFLLSSDARIVHANSAAQDLLLQSEGPVSGFAARLSARVGRADAALRAALALAARTDNPVCSQVDLGDDRYAACVDPLPGTPGLAVLTIRDLPNRRARTVAAAGDRFRLSPAEVALLQALMAGRSAEEHAEARGVAVSTVRSQLRSLFAKTETSRQAALLEHVASLPPD